MAVEITDHNFGSVVNSSKVVVVQFTAPWCGPCKAIAPAVDQLASEYQGRAVIGKLNIDQNRNVTGQFGIKHIPAILFFKNGQLVDKMGAGIHKQSIAQKINSLL